MVTAGGHFGRVLLVRVVHEGEVVVLRIFKAVPGLRQPRGVIPRGEIVQERVLGGDQHVRHRAGSIADIDQPRPQLPLQLRLVISCAGGHIDQVPLLTGAVPGPQPRHPGRVHLAAPEQLLAALAAGQLDVEALERVAAGAGGGLDEFAVIRGERGGDLGQVVDVAGEVESELLR